MSHYFVTGCAGFIGARVSEMLLADGHTVTGVDNLDGAYDVRLKHWRLERLRCHPSFRFCHLDITDRQALNVTFCQPGSACFDGIINLAARAGVRPSVSNPWAYYQTNVIGTVNILEFARERHIRKVVVASSSSVYGKRNQVPFSEDMDTDHPLSPYAASKAAVESLCHTYHHLYNTDITVFRYFTVYGPAGRPDMSLFKFTQAIAEGRPITVYGDGRQSRDFTYIDDIARGTILGLRPIDYAVINLGSDSPALLCEAIALIEQATGKKAIINYEPAQASDVPGTWANILRAEKLLTWHPLTSLAEGIEQFSYWYKANRDWAQAVSAR